MAPSRDVGIIIKFASKPSSVIVAFGKPDDSILARYVLVIDIITGTCPKEGSSHVSTDSYCIFDETNNQLTINIYGVSPIMSGYKAIVIPLYSTDLP